MLLSHRVIINLKGEFNTEIKVRIETTRSENG